MRRAIEDRDEDEDRDEERDRRDRARRDRVSTMLAIEDGSMEVDINEEMSHLQIMDGSLENPITVDYQPDLIVHPGSSERLRATHDFLAARGYTNRPFNEERLMEELREDGIHDLSC